MGINKRYIQKYIEAYKDLPPIIRPISFLPDAPCYRQEEWREISDRYIPGIRSGYYISTYGRIYSTIKSPNHPNGGFISCCKNEHGYYQTNLNSIDGKRICVKVSRLVMLCFRFIPGCEFMEVDHLDGDKSHNWIWNLEWVVPQENTHRAINNNQRTLSCSKQQGVLLSDIDARELFIRAINGEDKSILSKIYNVSEMYIKRLLSGADRPYIRREYNETILNKSIG